MKQIKL